MLVYSKMYRCIPSEFTDSKVNLVRSVWTACSFIPMDTNIFLQEGCHAELVLNNPHHHGYHAKPVLPSAPGTPSRVRPSSITLDTKSCWSFFINHGNQVELVLPLSPWIPCIHVVTSMYTRYLNTINVPQIRTIPHIQGRNGIILLRLSILDIHCYYHVPPIL